jgi:hypothetical protein
VRTARDAIRAGDRQLLALRAHPARAWVELDRPHDEDARARRLATPDERPESRIELRLGGRLGGVVVGTGVERGDALVVTDRGQQQDRRPDTCAAQG